MFLFETYHGFDMRGIDIGCEFREVCTLFLKHHCTGGD